MQVLACRCQPAGVGLWVLVWLTAWRSLTVKFICVLQHALLLLEHVRALPPPASTGLSVWVRRHACEDMFVQFGCGRRSYGNIRMMLGSLKLNCFRLLSKNVWLVELAVLGAAVVENVPDDAMRDRQLLFLRVLFIRYLHQGSFEGDKMAYKLLEEAQMSNYWQYFHIYMGSGLCWTEELDLCETRHDDAVLNDGDSGCEDTSKEGEGEGEGEGEEMDWMDKDNEEVQGNGEDDEDDDEDEYLPDAGDSSENEEEEEEMLPHFVKSAWKPHSLPPTALLQPQADTVQLPFFWAKNMTDFVYGLGATPGSEIIVDDLVAMRNVKPEQYRVPAFLNALEVQPGNLLETSHPDIEASFLDHDWKLSYSELICSWVEPTVSLEDYEKSQIPLKPDPEYFFNSSDAQDLLEFIEEHPQMHPWDFNPMTAFKIKGWNPDIPGFNGSWPYPHSLLLLVIRETADHHAFLQRVHLEAYRPSPTNQSIPGTKLTSLNMSDTTPLASLAPVSPPPPLPPLVSKLGRRAQRNKNKQNKKKAQKTSAGQHTKHEVLGKKKRIGPHAYCTANNDDPEELDSGLVTVRTAPMNLLRSSVFGSSIQRLKPKPAPKPKDSSTPKPVPKIRYYNPFKDLKMDLVEFRETVYEQCGKDIVWFVWKRPDGTEQIMCATFRAIVICLQDFAETLECLQQNHWLVKVTKIRCRGILEHWAYGSMTGGGSRHPLKGAKGDGYGPYKIHQKQGSPCTNIKTCTREAVDADTLVEIGNTIVPGMKAEITSLAVKSGVNFLGRTGLSNFTCTNHISCMHDDLDFSLEDFLKRQKKKKGRGAL
ncbi:hypothetical protein DFH08DRAFT_1023438 [Mycena albidolilacea]|uniref:Uncharacterized protein n=1 Tax=Mycena albidolilacea TaxID=1033008 RepID=A0AAD6ZNI6_9AGAR|nr:hypothetical protein DFH08DRAFT_1023438 [Mycena albidolilacea]